MKKMQRVLAIACAVAMITMIPSYFSYLHTRDLIVEEVGNHAKDIAAIASKLIEPDIEKYMELSSDASLKSGVYDQDFYNQELALLRNMKNVSDIEYIYTEKKISNKEFVYILDGENQDSSHFSPIGSKDKMSIDELEAFSSGTPTYSKRISRSAWGGFVSGFAPIINPKTGEVIGIVGVDYSAERVISLINNIQTIITLCAAATILFATILIYQISMQRKNATDIDYLTNSYSKRFFEKRLKTLIKNSKLFYRPFSVAMIDVDDFKCINDTFGHAAGDRTLKAIAFALKASTRETDACSRYGGDEFTIIFVNTSKEEAERICERIRDNLGVYTKMQVSVSMGISQWMPGMSEATLIQQADQAMYQSKKQGKNQITVYQE